MNPAFITTYKRSYKWHNQKKIPPFIPDDCYESFLEKDNVIWFVQPKLMKDDTVETLNEAKADLRRVLRKRLWSTYQVDYCKNIVEAQEEAMEKTVEKTIEKATENKLIEFCNKLYFRKQETSGRQENPRENEYLTFCNHIYGPRTQKIVPPLTTAKRVFGYIRPSNMYTPITTYHKDYGDWQYKPQIIQK